MSGRRKGVRLAIATIALSSHIARSQEVHPDHTSRSGSSEIASTNAAEHTKYGKIFDMPADCARTEVWDSITAMCMPLPHGMAMTHVMLHGNVFGVAVAQSGPRGEDGFASTQMLMGNIGRTFGDRHFLNLGIMTTFEKWTLPEKGYPLLLQTGESNKEGLPYVDAQHPHSSPIMGLTISDTIRLNQGKDHFKIFFAPRGQSTEGPIAFMHRPTGAIQPDAPLGHHIGQDVGHISSTVIGGLLRLGDTSLEVSAFNGAEPEPDKVDLPLAKPNSKAVRITQYLSNSIIAMASFASVENPHPQAHKAAIDGSESPPIEQEVNRMNRFSASVYSYGKIFENYDLYNALIYGSLKTFGAETLRHSLAHEFSLLKEASTVFGRTEILQRLPSELLLLDRPRPNAGRWLGALTVGYSHKVKSFRSARLNVGVSGTQYFLPGEFDRDYGKNPRAGKVFLQLSGMDMWSL